MEEKERLEKLEPAEALADRGEKTETIEAGSGEKDRREASLNMDGELSVEAVRRCFYGPVWPWESAWQRPVSWGLCFLCRTGSRQCS